MARVMRDDPPPANLDGTIQAPDRPFVLEVQVKADVTPEDEAMLIDALARLTVATYRRARQDRHP